MILLASERDLPWLPQPNEARFLLTTTLPPAHLSTSALVLAFHGDQLPPSDRCARGHRRAGGHIEADETSAAALRRECLEEVGATLGPVTLFATRELLVLVSLPLDPDAARALPAWPPLRLPLRGRTPRPRRIPSPHRPITAPSTPPPRPRYTSPHGCRCLWRHNSAGPPLGACARPAASDPAFPGMAR